MRQHKNERMHKPYISMERSEKHSFWMLAGDKWSLVGRTFDFRRYIHSNL